MRIQFLHESIGGFLASGRIHTSWANDESSFADHCDPGWEEPVAFAVERTGTVKPLTATLTDGDALNYPRRRAAELLARLGQPEHIATILDAFSAADHFVIVLAGYALRCILAKPSATKNLHVLGECLIEWTAPQSSTELKLAATKVCMGVGLVIGPPMTDAMLQALADPSAAVRATGLNALALVRTSTMMEKLASLLWDEDVIVRERALYALTSVVQTKRSPRIQQSFLQNVERFIAGFDASPADQYAAVFWIGRWNYQGLDTKYLIAALTDSKQHDIVRWTAARYLCSYPHRKNVTEDLWRSLSTCRDAARSAPVRSGSLVGAGTATRGMISELQYLREFFGNEVEQSCQSLHLQDIRDEGQKYSDDALAGLSGMMSRVEHQLTQPTLQLWENWLKVQADVDTRYGYFFGRSWQQAQACFAFFDLTAGQQAELVNHLAWQLSSDDQHKAEQAAHFIRHAWSTDERLLALRLLALTSRNAQITGYGLWGFNYHLCVVPSLIRLLHEDLDGTVRGDAGANLLYLVGSPALPVVLEQIRRDPSSLSRGYMIEYLRHFPENQEVHETLIQSFSNDVDPWVRVRAMRTYEWMGDDRGLTALAARFDDRERTRWGVVGETAREVYEAVVEFPNCMTNGFTGSSTLPGVTL